MLTADQFVGGGDGLREEQKQGSRLVEKNRKGKIRVLSTKTTKSKKLRIRNEILDM